MFKYYNPKLILSYRSYTVERICALYALKKLHPQTLRGWVNSGELETVSKEPMLIYGEVLKAFLQTRNDGHKKTLKIDQFKCVKCKDIYTPLNRAITLYRNKNGSLRAKGKCPSCTYQNSRFYKRSDEQILSELFTFIEPLVTTICNSLDTTSKTHLECDSKDTVNESSESSNAEDCKTNTEPEQLTLLGIEGLT